MGSTPRLVPHRRQVANGGWLQTASQSLMLGKGRSPCKQLHWLFTKKSKTESKATQKTSSKILRDTPYTKAAGDKEKQEGLSFYLPSGHREIINGSLEEVGNILLGSIRPGGLQEGEGGLAGTSPGDSPSAGTRPGLLPTGATGSRTPAGGTPAHHGPSPHRPPWGGSHGVEPVTQPASPN